MKACSKNRKQIALLALGSESRLQPARRNSKAHSSIPSPSLPNVPPTSDPAFQHLIAHLQTCSGCRQYFNELSTVTTFLASTSHQAHPELVATESFHLRVAKAIDAHRLPAPRLIGNWLSTIGERLQLRFQLPRIAVPALAAIAAGLLLMLMFHQASTVAPPRPSAAMRQTPVTESHPSPTLANYQAVANRSLDQFDDLLTLQANKNPHPAPVYTASLLRTTAMPE